MYSLFPGLDPPPLDPMLALYMYRPSSGHCSVFKSQTAPSTGKVSTEVSWYWTRLYTCLLRHRLTSVFPVLQMSTCMIFINTFCEFYTAHSATTFAHLSTAWTFLSNAAIIVHMARGGIYISLVTSTYVFTIAPTTEPIFPLGPFHRILGLSSFFFAKNDVE